MAFLYNLIGCTIIVAFFTWLLWLGAKAENDPSQYYQRRISALTVEQFAVCQKFKGGAQ